MTDGTVTILPSTAEWLERLGLGEGGTLLSCEWAAWVLYLLRELEDTEGRFPHGKWATIQSIERQVVANAKARASEISE